MLFVKKTPLHSSKPFFDILSIGIIGHMLLRLSIQRKATTDALKSLASEMDKRAARGPAAAGDDDQKVTFGRVPRKLDDKNSFLR